MTPKIVQPATTRRVVPAHGERGRVGIERGAGADIDARCGCCGGSERVLRRRRGGRIHELLEVEGVRVRFRVPVCVPAAGGGV
jgi:hypothetical protein